MNPSDYDWNLERVCLIIALCLLGFLAGYINDHFPF